MLLARPVVTFGARLQTMSEPGDPPPHDPTTQMPATEAGATPTADHELSEPRKPWYRRPGPLAAVLIGVLLLFGIGGFVLYQVLDEDDPSTVSILRIDRVDQQGNPMSREIEATVVGAAGAENDFLWLIPPNATAPLPAVTATSGSAGRAEFQWGPTNDVDGPQDWTSTIVLQETFTAQEALLNSEIECALQRRGEPAGTVRLVVTFENPADLTADRTATYSFSSHMFLAGDVVRCVVQNGPSVGPTDTTTPPGTTLPAESTTTIPETTTTTPEATTTVPDATTTTVPDATTTTVPEETTTTALAGPTVLEVIRDRSDLSRLSELVTLADLEADFSNPALTLTLFAPNNDAFAAAEASPDAPDYSDPGVVRSILLTHLHGQAVLSSAEVLALPEISVASGDTVAIDAGADPPTVGGAPIIGPDVAASNGVLHVVSSVIDPTAGS